MHKQFLRGRRIVRFLITDDERFLGESNASFVARIAWKYRVNPAQLVSKAILGKSHTNADLRYDIASVCNSLTDKSVHVQGMLYELTGLDRNSGNYVFLRELIDHGAHGLISKDKKWCHLCYQDRLRTPVPEDETPIYDDLYWSFKHSNYCTKHLCTLSVRCGHCFEKQPYVSHRVEPGFCHYCRGFLGKAPSFDTSDDIDALEVARADMARHDLFLRNGVPSEHISMRVLARNLRQLAHRFGEDGMDLVASACGVSHATYVDWCRAKHHIAVQSLFMLLEGLQLPSLGILLADEAEFCNAVSSQLSSQFQFRAKAHHESVLPKITKYLNEIVAGVRPPESRAAIAKRFSVSVGMLENAFLDELKQVSIQYKKATEEISSERKGDLQYLMDVAVRRCGAKMRTFQWEHLLAELKGVSLNGYSHIQLSDARTKAIQRYIDSTRRDQGRDINRLL